MNFKNRRVHLVFAVFLVILSATVYFYENIRIPKLTKDVQAELRMEIDVNAMPKTSVAMVIDPEGIAKYTEITEEILDKKIKLVEVPTKFVPEGAVIDLSMILGKITKEPLRKGEQLILDSFSIEEKWFDEFERLKEYSIKSTVADTLKSGNIVDILVVYGNGDYDVVVPKVKIKKLVKSDITNSDGNKSVQIVIPVNEVDTRDMIAASQLGEFDVRIYLDESQSASPKTFDYEKAKEQLQLLNTSKKAEEEVIEENSEKQDDNTKDIKYLN